MTSLRWGILGTGNIARQFAAGFSSAQRSVITAVGSRSIQTAKTFAQNYQIASAVGSYDDLLRSKDVDAVYVSLPNSMHHEWTIKALRVGKHVLCEKPFASNTAEAQEMFDVAQKTGRVLVEAFMYRSHPLIHAVIDAIQAGKIGQIRLIRTSFSFRVWNTVGNIRFDPALAGGALMDIGCYCINFSRMIAGAEPTSMHAVGQLHASGVDELAAGVMQFPGNITATFSCGMNAQADNTAYICGTDGYIEIPVPWKPPAQNAIWSIAYSTPPRMDQTAGVPPQPLTPSPMYAGERAGVRADAASGAGSQSLSRNDPSPQPSPPSTGEREQEAAAHLPPRPRPKETFSVDAGKSLYALEADDFAEAVLEGKPVRVSAQDTLGNMRILDELRREIGVKLSP